MAREGELEEALGVRFLDAGLLRLALVHSSYINENPGVFAESNERLEFLGDAVLGVAVAEELYAANPSWSEGRLTQARSAAGAGGHTCGGGAGHRAGGDVAHGKGRGGRRRA